MLAVWLTMCSTVVPMARGGRGDIPGKDPVLVVVIYIYIFIHTSYTVWTHH